MASVIRGPGRKVTGDLTLQLRSYQNEMFRRSMKENVIVAVCSLASIYPTRTNNDSDGYGKWKDTHVRNLHTISRLMPFSRALLRIAEEIDRCPPGKVSTTESHQLTSTYTL
jgi:hypothetical protein